MKLVYGVKRAGRENKGWKLRGERGTVLGEDEFLSPVRTGECFTCAVVCFGGGLVIICGGAIAKTEGVSYGRIE